MDNKENNTPLSGERVEEPKQKCTKCGSRTALISGIWYYGPDQEPYENGVIEPTERSESEAYMNGFICDDCDTIQDVFVDEENYKSRIAELEDQLKKTVTVKNYVESVYGLECTVEELESENSKLREALGSLKQFLYNEITERRNYSASKSFEIVLEQIEIAEQSINGNEK